MIFHYPMEIFPLNQWNSIESRGKLYHIFSPLYQRNRFLGCKITDLVCLAQMVHSLTKVHICLACTKVRRADNIHQGRAGPSCEGRANGRFSPTAEGPVHGLFYLNTQLQVDFSLTLAFSAFLNRLEIIAYRKMNNPLSEIECFCECL